MAYIINADCINCGACEGTCPVDCIAPGDEIYVIDADACIDCAACVDSCPVDAIQPG
ncbi:MAG: 4Fe-4S binding protein [Oscillospiraceae bacterium]|nr:4Fe-4S binding protein [Oscillospiraceae bacterium]